MILLADLHQDHQWNIGSRPESLTNQLNLGVSKNSGTPKSPILIGFSIINHPFWGTPIFGNTQLEITATLRFEILSFFESLSPWRFHGVGFRSLFRARLAHFFGVPSGSNSGGGGGGV